MYFFFFKQKTAYEMRISDWSSDVCSSDLAAIADDPELGTTHAVAGARQRTLLLQRANALVEHLADQRLAANHFDTRPGRALTFEHETLDRLHRRIGRDVGVTPDADIRHDVDVAAVVLIEHRRSEEHTSELQSLMRISYAVFCLKKKN